MRSAQKVLANPLENWPFPKGRDGEEVGHVDKPRDP